MDFKVGDTVIIKEKPICWASGRLIKRKCPIYLYDRKVNYPFIGVINEIDEPISDGRHDFIACDISGYGFDLMDLEEKGNIELLEKEEELIMPEVFKESKLNKFLEHGI